MINIVIQYESYICDNLCILQYNIIQCFMVTRGQKLWIYKNFRSIIHWPRSAVNSAGALQGISGNFHPQKHIYYKFRGGE